VQEHYILIVEKREKSKVFDVFRRKFRGEKREDLPRKVLQNARNRFLFFN